MRIVLTSVFCIFFFKQKTAYEMRISDWSSDVCSSDLIGGLEQEIAAHLAAPAADDAGPLQVEQDLFEEFLRYALADGDIGDQHRLARIGLGKGREPSKRISRLLGYHHATIGFVLPCSGCRGQAGGPFEPPSPA